MLWEPKRWGTLSETTLEQGAAAERDGFNIMHQESDSPDVNLEDAYFSKFAVPHEIFTKNVADEEAGPKQHLLCLGHSTWACLMGPLSHVADGGEMYFFVMPAESARWEHICKPLDRSFSKRTAMGFHVQCSQAFQDFSRGNNQRKG